VSSPVKYDRPNIYPRLHHAVPTGFPFFAATGDGGAPGGWPAFSSNVVAVGGTTLLLNSDGSYYGETGWSGSGGGISDVESEPDYQQGVQASGQRSIPMFSMDADPASSGWAIYDSHDGGWFGVGGTSLATPMWAAVVCHRRSGPGEQRPAFARRATQLLPILYKSSTSLFNDVTSGSNGLFLAGPGYDLVTGIRIADRQFNCCRRWPSASAEPSGVSITSTANPAVLSSADHPVSDSHGHERSDHSKWNGHVQRRFNDARYRCIEWVGDRQSDNLFVGGGHAFHFCGI